MEHFDKIISHDVIHELVIRIKLPGTLRSEQIIPIVQSGISKFTNGKVPQLSDIIGVAGVLARDVGAFKISGLEKQELVIEIMDIILIYISSSLRVELDSLRHLSRESLPAILSLAYGNRDIRNNSGLLRTIGRKLLSFVRHLIPSVGICGLSQSSLNAVLDKGDAIVGPPPKQDTPVLEKLYEKEPGPLRVPSISLDKEENCLVSTEDLQLHLEGEAPIIQDILHHASESCSTPEIHTPRFQKVVYDA